MSVALLKTEGESLGAWDVLGEREDESGVLLVLGGVLRILALREGRREEKRNEK